MFRRKPSQEQHRQGHHPQNEPHQKNWLPCVTASGELPVQYSIEPHVLLRVDVAEDAERRRLVLRQGLREGVAAAAPLALHQWPANVTAGKGCVYPGICKPPSTTYSRVMTGPVPGQQWNTVNARSFFSGIF